MPHMTFAAGADDMQPARAVLSIPHLAAHRCTGAHIVSAIMLSNSNYSKHLDPDAPFTEVI